MSLVCYCTILSKYRVDQGIALYNSLEANTKVFILFILCMDEETYEILCKLQLKYCVLTKVSAIEDQELLSIKQNRKT